MPDRIVRAGGPQVAWSQLARLVLARDRHERVTVYGAVAVAARCVDEGPVAGQRRRSSSWSTSVGVSGENTSDRSALRAGVTVKVTGGRPGCRRSSGVRARSRRRPAGVASAARSASSRCSANWSKVTTRQ